MLKFQDSEKKVHGFLNILTKFNMRWTHLPTATFKINGLRKIYGSAVADNIILKPAEKGSALVVMDKRDNM